MKEQLESIKLFNSSNTNAPLAYMRQLADSDVEDEENEEDGNDGNGNTNENTKYSILTRRRTLAMKASSTLFNVKALSNISDLFHAIDTARKKRNQLLQPSSSSSTSYLSDNLSENTKNPHLNSTTPLKSIQLASHYDRSKLFEIIRKIFTNDIAPKFSERLWTCLLPTSNYPLSHEFASTIDPTSLFQRSIFTPAEDDLLLRGMIMTSYENSSGVSHTEGTDWDEVQRRFLPSKDTTLLQYRQIQLISCEENSKFQRFIFIFIN